MSFRSVGYALSGALARLGRLPGLRTARGRAILASAVLMLLLGGVVAMTIWRAESDQAARRSLEQRSAVAAAVDNARAQALTAGSLLAAAVFTEDPTSPVERARQAQAAAEEALDQARAELIAAGETDELAAFDSLSQQMEQVGEEVEVVVAAAPTTDLSTRIQIGQQYFTQMSEPYDAMLAGLTELAISQQDKLAAERAAADKASDRSLTVLVGFSMFTLIAGVTSLLMLSLSVVRPLGSLRDSVRAIASGNREAKAAVSGPEEVASLADDFNDMVAGRNTAEEGLRNARDELERRVKERTAALKAANKELERLAKTDSLTGLANHRSLLDMFADEIKRSTESGEPLSVVIMDIDGFKLFNDTYGHPLGDLVLRLVADMLRKETDGSGIPGRYGGDEFIVILPGADKAAGRDFANRLATASGAIELRTGHDSHLPISLSLGVASFPEDTQSKDRLLALADAAMYEAKRLAGAGRIGPRVVAVGSQQFESVFGALDSLVQAIQYRDHYTKTHSDVVADYSARLALQVGLSEENARALRIAGALHDIGKIVVPDEILKKPGALTNEEREAMKRHPTVGESLIRETPFLEEVMQAVGCHHERYDGKGYPRGLEGRAIPYLGRIIAIADAYSAMGLDRPYRKALDHDEIITELKAGAGTQFDPELIDIFVDMLEADRRAKAA